MASWCFEGGKASRKSHMQERRLRKRVHSVMRFEEEAREICPPMRRVEFLYHIRINLLCSEEGAERRGWRAYAERVIHVHVSAVFCAWRRREAEE